MLDSLKKTARVVITISSNSELFGRYCDIGYDLLA